MGVCSAVREMALAIDARFGGDDPQVRRAARAVASMPDWSAERRLDRWEEHVQDVLAPQPETSSPLSLLDGVFEFGRLNLYGAFRPERTVEEFRRVTTRFGQQGLEVDVRQSVSEW